MGEPINQRPSGPAEIVPCVGGPHDGQQAWIGVSDDDVVIDGERYVQSPIIHPQRAWTFLRHASISYDVAIVGLLANYRPQRPLPPPPARTPDAW